MVRKKNLNRFLSGVILGLLLSTVGCMRSANYYLDKGNELFAKGNFAEAELNYRKAIQKDQNLGEAHYRAAWPP